MTENNKSEKGENMRATEQQKKTILEGFTELSKGLHGSHAKDLSKIELAYLSTKVNEAIRAIGEEKLLTDMMKKIKELKSELD